MVSEDLGFQYVPIMNAIFAAKKKSILIDSCILGPHDSILLQQGTHLTGGIYLKPNQPNCILTYLLSVFLCDKYSRQIFPMPIQSRVNFSASCFCHKKNIQEGHVCSYCLSIYCTIPDQCKTCDMINQQKPT